MSGWRFKGTDGRSKFYDKAPDKDGYVATKRTNMSGSAGTESFKDTTGGTPLLGVWLWRYRREIIAVIIAVAGFVLTISKKWLSTTRQVISHINGKTRISSRSFYFKLAISLAPSLILVFVVLLAINAN